MASACVNNVGMSPERILDCAPPYSSYGWLSPRISFSRDFVDERIKIAGEKPEASLIPAETAGNPPEKVDLEASGMDFVDFEFRPDDPFTMLPADELFSEGKLVPLQLASIRPLVESTVEIRSPEPVKSRRRVEISGSDPYVFSPKAPRCSSRWKELLGLKKLQSPKPELQKTASLPSKNPNPKSLKHFLHRNPKSSSNDSSSLSLPLLRDSDSESVSISSRLSLSSSSSSGPDHEDLPRLSLDTDKPMKNPPKVRLSRPRSVTVESNQRARVGRSPIRRPPEAAAVPAARGASVDSPRMNSSGKIVFESLERSSSSPSSFNGGPRAKHRGMERSYSANVRFTPVLNVPICSLRGSAKSVSGFGFGQLFSSPQKRDSVGARTSNKSKNEKNEKL